MSGQCQFHLSVIPMFTKPYELNILVVKYLFPPEHICSFHGQKFATSSRSALSAVNREKFKMASKRLSSRGTDYVQLNNFSSVVLYNEPVARRKRGKIYEVERIIGRKKTKHVSIKAKLIDRTEQIQQSQLHI